MSPRIHRSSAQPICSSLPAWFGNSRSTAAFRRTLLHWYDRNKRDLPWRQTRDPYRIWVSEVMSQQTRVAAVIDYYRRFLDRFPDVESLARAKLSTVLAAWSGLGYYRRARFLHAAAQQIVSEHKGKFPQNAEAVSDLPGFGRYTTAAVLSIAFGEPMPVVDGNVRRVLHRVLAVEATERHLWELAEAILDKERPGDFNQAMMELGATVCVPGTPKCPECPVKRWCHTRGAGNQRKAVLRKRGQLHYSYVSRDGAVWLVRRSQRASLMPGMWELPSVAPTGEGETAWLTLKHSITVTDYDVKVWRAASPSGSPGRWITSTQVAALPLTGLARKILRRANFI